MATEPNGTSPSTEGGDGEEEGGGEGEGGEDHADAALVNEVIEKAVEQEEVKKHKEEKVSRFGKLFKKKPHVKDVPKEESSGEAAAGVGPPEPEPQQVSTPRFCSSNPTNPISSHLFFHSCSNTIEDIFDL